MNTTNLSDNYFDSVFSAISSSLATMGAPVPAVSKIAMEDNSPYRILASTIISLRTRDSATWEASINLFKLAPTIDKLYSVDESLVAESIKKCGFYLRKANQLKKIAQIVMEEWRGGNTTRRRKIDVIARCRNQNSKSCFEPFFLNGCNMCRLSCPPDCQ